MKVFFFMLFLIKFMFVSAQCITIAYDAAGDRIARNICPQALQAPSVPSIAKNDVTLQFASNERDIQIFPNPTNGILEIRSDYFSSGSKVMITDILGRNFYSGRLSTSRVDLTKFQAGRYYVRIMDGDRVRVVSVIKN